MPIIAIDREINMKSDCDIPKGGGKKKKTKIRKKAYVVKGN